MKRHGRKEPYTEAGVRRLPCVRCGAASRFQWNACADGNVWRPLCGACDVALNRLVLGFMKDPDADTKADAYAASRGIA
jgi:hypothetical protein